MKRILKSFASSIAGFIGFCLCGFIAVSCITSSLLEEDYTKITQQNFILSCSFDRMMSEGQFIKLLLSIKRAGFDDRVKGIALMLDDCGLGFSEVYELSKTLKSINKPIYSYGAYIDNAAYLLSCVSKMIYMHPCGSLNLTGSYIPVQFFKGFFDKIGVSFCIEKREEYKTYANMFSETEMTRHQRENLEAILQNGRQLFVDQISIRKIEDIDTIMNDGPYPLNGAMRLKLIDAGLSYRDAISDIKKDANCDNFVLMSDYASEYVVTKATKNIGVICLDGNILDRSNGYEDHPVITRKGIEKIIETIKTSKVKYDGYVIRINSPGGSAVASDDVVHELVDFLGKMNVPAAVSMGTCAASGGYWISCGLRKPIFATPYTLTGSIGVVGMLPNVRELMKKLGISSDIVSIGENAAFGDITREMTDKQKKKFAEIIDSIYDDFLKHVSRSRNISLDDVHRIAKGRVWSGNDALQNQLIDNIGSFFDAVDYVKKELSAEDVNIVVLKEPMPIFAAMIRKCRLLNDVVFDALISQIHCRLTKMNEVSIECKI